jgi:hypothetical protein
MNKKTKFWLENPYIRIGFALTITILVIYFLGRNLFTPTIKGDILLIRLAVIVGTLFIFFAFSLWLVNQQKRWISSWATHPVWVFLTFILLPAFSILIQKMTFFLDVVPVEFVVQFRNLRLLHFTFFYFWEGLVFGVAFLAHPDRKKIIWRLSHQEILLSLLLGFGSWSIIMLINEIQLQWNHVPINYMENTSIFWPILPFALVIIPVAISYFFFYQGKSDNLFQTILTIILFIILPLRAACILPAFIIGIIFSIVTRKTKSFSVIVIMYVIINIFTLLLNWQWVI